MNARTALACCLWALSCASIATGGSQNFTAEIHSCADMQSSCLTACALRGKLGDARCTDSCLAPCTAAADVESCYYNADTGVCLALACDGEGSCSSVGSSQPDNSACNAHCGAQARTVAQIHDLLTAKCQPGDKGCGDPLADTESACTYFGNSGECSFTTCPDGEDCTTSGSSQPDYASCLTFCDSVGGN